MQKLAYNTRSQARLPMLDISNIPSSNRYLFRKPADTARCDLNRTVALKDYSSRVSSSLDLRRCLHSNKIRSTNGRFGHCADCGAFVSDVFAARSQN